MRISIPKLLLFGAIIFLCSCKKDENVTPSQQYYVKGTLNGVAFNWEDDNKNCGATYGVVVSTDQNNNGVAELQGGINTRNSKQFVPSISIGFRTFQVANMDKTALTAYFNSFITTGNWSYAPNDILSDNTKNVVIYYNDADGNEYTSEGVQNGYTANITSVEQGASSPGIPSTLNITLTFSCTLYNTNGYSPSITLTNAQASVNVPDLLFNN